MKPTFILTLFVLASVAAGPAAADLDSILCFEGPNGTGGLTGWGGGPRSTLSADSVVVHGGRWSARIDRSKDSPSHFSALTQIMPIDFGGGSITLHGFLKTDSVDGNAGIWMREDGSQGPVEFDNMHDQNLRGTTGWTEYTITLPLNPRAKSLYFGALLSGTGTVWADDFRLLVDGKPVGEAPEAEPVEAAIDSDHEFDKGSGIELGSLSPVQIGNLVTLGKVWGFLKYHHPRVTNGEMNWDYELFRVMPEVLAAPDRDRANAVLVEWIRRLGPVPACEPCAELSDSLELGPDMDWIHDTSVLGDSLSAALQHIYKNRTMASQVYAGATPGVGNVDLSSEKPYPSQVDPDGGYRMLALFRFWNVVRYWYPYRDVIGEPWDDVLAEFVPRLAGAKGIEAYRRELLALIARVHDTHANLWNALDARPPAGDCRLPVALRFLGGKAVMCAPPDSKLAGQTDLEPGDIVLDLDGAPVDSLVRAWTPYYAASNVPARLRDMARTLPMGPCGPCRVRVERQGRTLVVEATRGTSSEIPQARRSHDLAGPAFRKLSPEVAYLKLSAVKVVDVDSYLRQAEGTRGWVLDLRNYPSEFVVFALGRHLVQEPTSFVKFTHVDTGNPGAFAWGVPLALEPLEPIYRGKVVILVDEITQSSAEYTAMAFRAAPGAVVVGSTTAGADGNVSRFPLPGGLLTMISGIGVFYPDGRPTQRVGIVPDVEVHPTVEGIREGRDEVLEEGIRQILGTSVPEAAIEKMAKG